MILFSEFVFINLLLFIYKDKAKMRYMISTGKGLKLPTQKNGGSTKMNIIIMGGNIMKVINNKSLIRKAFIEDPTVWCTA